VKTKAVIFDFDGVIVDTPKLSSRTWKEAFKGKETLT
jgi:beta-phosphoglucomutase-like phosphatase (HAD superfamily)